MIKSNEKGLLIVVSGPSGCGKSTLNQMLLKIRNNIVMSISDTTRLPRENEKNGIDYNFISKEEFLNNIRNNKYLEYGKENNQRIKQEEELIELIKKLPKEKTNEIIKYLTGMIYE